MRWLLIISCFAFCSAAQAQKVTGRIIASKTYTPVGDVLVANKRTGETTYSDSTGRYTLAINEGDLLFFHRIGFHDTRQTAHVSGGQLATVIMTASDIELAEVQIRGSNYKLDSIERSILYRKPLNDANEKVKVHLGTGVVFDGLIGKVASKLTGREKRVQRFKKQFVAGEQEKFIATRYTIPLITRITGLTGEAAGIFMNAYPMPYDFARTATELELQMWVRNNYKQYSNKSKEMK